MKLKEKEAELISRYSKRELGAWGERQAADYLAANGMVILDRNWRCKYGEIDLIVFDQQNQAIIAVEVKTRRSIQAGIPEESITAQKTRRLNLLIVEWLEANREICRNLSWNELKVQAIAIEVKKNNYILRYLSEL